MTLFLLTPLIPLSWYLSKKKLNLKYSLYGALTLLVTSIPLIVFEVKHGFQQTRALYSSLTISQGSKLSTPDQFRRVIHIFSQNVTTLVFHPPEKYFLPVTFAFFVLFSFLVAKKFFSKNQSIIILLWQTLILLFFSLYSKRVSEYYLHSMMIIWFAVLTGGIWIILSKRPRIYGLLILIVFAILNIDRFLNQPLSKNGYIDRRSIVSEIKKDAQVRGFPCISVSYITDPGYNFGYRYLFWLENIHVNNPDSGSPVYSIVFPLKPIFEVDKTFGGIGLIYPDYSKYTKEGILKSCSGQDSNLTDPMFGFTQ